jgi:hypothetical protein
MSAARVADAAPASRKDTDVPSIDNGTRFDFIAENSLLLAHMITLVVLIFLLMVGGTIPESTRNFSKELRECLAEESSSHKAAMTVFKSLEEQTGNCRTFDTVEATWEMLVDTMRNAEKKSKAGTATTWLGYGTGDGQFYDVVDCHAKANANAEYCMKAQGRYVVKAVSAPVFDDITEHHFSFNEKGDSEMGGSNRFVGSGRFEFISHGKPYDPRTRPWYYFGFGTGVNGTWGTYRDSLTGMELSAYARTFDNGVIAAATVLQEEVCYKNSKEEEEDAKKFKNSELYHKGEVWTEDQREAAGEAYARENTP